MVSASHDVLLRPLQLLELMAAETAGALGDDPIGAERLRMLLYLSAPFNSLVDEARVLSDAAERAAGDRAEDYEPGILDHGALTMVALAAMRVAPGKIR